MRVAKCQREQREGDRADIVLVSYRMPVHDTVCKDQVTYVSLFAISSICVSGRCGRTTGGNLSPSTLLPRLPLLLLSLRPPTLATVTSPELLLLLLLVLPGEIASTSPKLAFRFKLPVIESYCSNDLGRGCELEAVGA